MGEEDGEPLAGTITQLIDRIQSGNEAAQAELCELVYNELLAIGRRMRRRSGSCSLATTEVVHEYLGRIFSDGRFGQMKNRRYFYAAAADQMRRLLIDHWRHKKTKAAGGHMERQGLDPWLDELTDSAASRCGGDLEALELALAQLQVDRPRQYEVVQLKFFAGLTNDMIAETLGVSVDTVKREWQRARARLGACLQEE